MKVTACVYNNVLPSQTCRRTSPHLSRTVHDVSQGSTHATTRRLGRLTTGSRSWRIKSGNTLADPRFQIHCHAN